MVEVQVVEHIVPKETHWGVVDKSLNQHIVRVKDGDKFVMCGYIGTKAFLPLSGFPKELVDEVADECEKLLNRKIERIAPPPSLTQIAEMLKR